jgi:hypothetical protein
MMIINRSKIVYCALIYIMEASNLHSAGVKKFQFILFLGGMAANFTTKMRIEMRAPMVLTC